MKKFEITVDDDVSIELIKDLFEFAHITIEIVELEEISTQKTCSRGFNMYE